jgi:hypothetical protein
MVRIRLNGRNFAIHQFHFQAAAGLADPAECVFGFARHEGGSVFAPIMAETMLKIISDFTKVINFVSRNLVAGGLFDEPRPNRHVFLSIL